METWRIADILCLSAPIRVDMRAGFTSNSGSSNMLRTIRTADCTQLLFTKPQRLQRMTNTPGPITRPFVLLKQSGCGTRDKI
jgi:hypothetical protein